MIQGYAIYLRTHRETGKQYGGMCWWTKPTQTPEKACKRRWRTEDMKGIGGLFGGFDSKIILSEKRADAPEMSEGLYRIRIFVDESKVVDRIPRKKRLNRISPLVQIQCTGEINAVVLATAHQTMRDNGHYQKLKDSGHYVRNGEKQGRALWRNMSPEDRAIRSQRSHEIGLSHKENKTAIFARTSEQMEAQGRKNGMLTKAAGVGIFGLTPAQKISASKLGAQAAIAKKVGVFGRSPEQMSEDGRIGAAAAKAQGVGFYGPDHQENSRRGALNQSREDKARGGRTQGRISYEQKSGIHGRTAEQKILDGRKGGLAGTVRGTHNRWHIKRGVVSPKCRLCREKQ
jgi:hypothetical protein